MKMKIKNRSHRYYINRPRSRHGQEYSKYKKCLSMMMLIYIKQHVRNIEAQFMEKLSNTEAELKKSVVYKKSVYFKRALVSWNGNLYHQMVKGISFNCFETVSKGIYSRL